MNEHDFANSAALSHRVRKEDIFRHDKRPKLVRARWDAWGKARKAGWSLDNIADAFDRDRSTIIHGLRERAKL